MPWDADEIASAYIDYLAEHESGFMGELPVQLISQEQALRQIAFDAGASMRTLVGPQRRSSTQRHRRSHMAKKNASSKKDKAAKKIDKAAAREQKKIVKRDKKIAKIQKKVDRLLDQIDKLNRKMPKTKVKAVK